MKRTHPVEPSNTPLDCVKPLSKMVEIKNSSLRLLPPALF